jgi:hypothetical protein
MENQIYPEPLWTIFVIGSATVLMLGSAMITLFIVFYNKIAALKSSHLKEIAILSDHLEEMQETNMSIYLERQKFLTSYIEELVVLYQIAEDDMKFNEGWIEACHRINEIANEEFLIISRYTSFLDNLERPLNILLHTYFSNLNAAMAGAVSHTLNVFSSVDIGAKKSLFYTLQAITSASLAESCYHIHIEQNELSFHIQYIGDVGEAKLLISRLAILEHSFGITLATHKVERGIIEIDLPFVYSGKKIA